VKRFALIGFCIFFLGCTNRISKEDLELLNGYWEIDKVVFSDGNTKEYNVNTSIDFIEWKDGKGFRKKVQPSLNGTYQTSDDAEAFVITEVDGNFLVNYKNELSEWSEQLVQLSSTTFSVVNEEGVRYVYNRFEGITL